MYGQLFYGRRKPRRVIWSDQEQNEILIKIHIDSSTGNGKFD